MRFNPEEKSPIPESYSRHIDQTVLALEMPYGYTGAPPPADTGDYDQRRLESKTQYSLHKGKAV